MFKKVFAVLALAAASIFATSGALAADTIKGVNQNGFYAVQPIEPIAAIKYADGKLYYRNQFSSTEYHIVDGSATERTKVLNAWTGNAATNAVDGWTYNLRKTQVTCSPSSSSTSIFVLGQNQSSTQSDGCQFWQTANSY